MKRFDMTKSLIGENFIIQNMGYSRIYNKWDIKKAVIEAKAAYRIAQSMDKKEQKFAPLTSYPLLLSVKNSYEAKCFYDSFMDVLNRNTSPEHREAILESLNEYVLSGGDYKIVAEKLNQHENTIRYRMGRLRTWLDMEDNNIQFYETISLIVKMNQLRTSK